MLLLPPVKSSTKKERKTVVMNSDSQLQFLTCFSIAPLSKKEELTTPNATLAKQYFTIERNFLKTSSNQRNLLLSFLEIAIYKKAFSMSPTRATFLEKKRIRNSNKRGVSCGLFYKQLLRLAPFETADALNKNLNLVVALQFRITGWWGK